MREAVIISGTARESVNAQPLLALVSRSEVSTGDSCRFVCEVVGRLVGAIDADAVASFWCEVRDEPFINVLQSVELDDVLGGPSIVAEDDGVPSLQLA
ncbi:hypothetical protein [Bradyrhizobium sp. BR 1432]|uniref:hypothetical protein n=1 Tax=Bradyrhizobium sp. BR 1432 TaxID=3447966 RepID=UPI003EE5D408